MESTTTQQPKETKKDALRRLFVQNNLHEDDVYKDKRGFVIITRSGIEKIQFNNNMDRTKIQVNRIFFFPQCPKSE